MPLDPSAILAARPPAPVDYQGMLDNAAIIKVRQAQAQQAQQDMAAQQRLHQLAQQYGDDPDRLVTEMGREFPMQAQKLAEQIGQARTAGAQAHLKDLEVGKAQLNQGLSLLQGANADNWQDVSGAITKMAPQLTPYVRRPYSDDLRDGLIRMGQSADQFVDTQQKAAQLLVDGKARESVATLYAGADTPQKRTIADGLVKQAGLGSLGQYFPDQASAQAYITAQQKPQEDKTQGAEIEAIKAWKRDHPGQEPSQKDIEQIHRGFKEAGTIVRVSTAQAGGGSGALTSEGVDYAATQFRLTGKMPTMGMGNGPARAAIINKAAEQARLIGQSPVAAIQRQASYAADGKSLSKMQSMSDAASAYEQKALAQLDIVDSLSSKVNRTRIPLLNQAILAGKTKIEGDPDATMLLNAIQTATSEYAKIMSGGTGSAQGSTDAARREAATLLSASFSKGTLAKQTQLMRKEMQLTMDGYGATIDHINERMGGQPQPAAAPQAPAGGKVQQWKRDASGKLVPQ